MKIKNLTLGLLLIGSLTMVGCDDVKDTGEAMRNQPTKKSEEKIENHESEQNVQEPITQKEAEKLIRDIYKKHGEEKINLSLHGENEDGITDDGNFYMFSKGYSIHAPEAATIIKVNRYTKEVLYVPTNTYITDRATAKEDKPLDQYLKELEEFQNGSSEEEGSEKSMCDLCGKLKPTEGFGEWESKIDGTVYYGCEDCREGLKEEEELHIPVKCPECGGETSDIDMQGTGKCSKCQGL